MPYHVSESTLSNKILYQEAKKCVIKKLKKISYQKTLSRLKKAVPDQGTLTRV